MDKPRMLKEDRSLIHSMLKSGMGVEDIAVLTKKARRYIVPALVRAEIAYLRAVGDLDRVLGRGR